MNLVDRAGLPGAELRALEREVASHRSLVDALAYCQAQGHARAVPEVVVQDEYTHDVVFPWRERRVLVYGVT